MTDEELMDSVIRLNDFLDSVFGMAKKVVFAGLIVGGASVATVVPIWPLVSQRPWNFAATGLLLLVAGGLTGAAVTLAATKGRTRRQLEARDRIIAAKDAEISELKDRSSRESVDSLKESHASALAAKDAEIAEAVENATEPLQEQIDRILNRENFALMRLRGLSLKELGIVKKFMTQNGEVYLKADDASVRKLADSGMIRINADTYCPPDRYPFTLDDSLRSLLVEFPDTLDEAIAEAESVKSRYSEGKP